MFHSFVPRALKVPDELRFAGMQQQVQWWYEVNQCKSHRKRDKKLLAAEILRKAFLLGPAVLTPFLTLGPPRGIQRLKTIVSAEEAEASS